MALVLAAACASRGTTVTKKVSNPDQRLSVLSISTLPTSIGPVVVGEIQNRSSSPVGGIEVTVSLKDPKGSGIGQEFGFTLLHVVPAGTKAPFTIPFTGGARSVGAVSATVQADPSVVEEYVPLTIATQASLTLGSAYEVTGTVQNSTSKPVKFANVVGTFYDHSGTMVGAAHDVSTNPSLAPGQTAQFELVLQEQGRLVARYTLASEAQVVAADH
jgi:hypothetical protein